MSIRLIARALYHLQQEVEALEKQIFAAGDEMRPALEDKLRKVKAERDRMKNALEGQKSNAKQ